MAFFAHSGLRPDDADWQPLREHLHNVAGMAGFLACVRLSSGPHAPRGPASLPIRPPLEGGRMIPLQQKVLKSRLDDAPMRVEDTGRWSLWSLPYI